MAIYHDVYLFDAVKATAYISPYIDILTTKDASTFAYNVLEVYKTNAILRELADEYGGWDQQSLEQEIQAISGNKVEDIGFFLTFLIYSQLSTIEGSDMGLGQDFEILADILEYIGWSQEDKNRLIFGRNFKEMPQNTNRKNQQAAAYWEYIKPSATAASMGWLGVKDVRYLLGKLKQSDNPKLDVNSAVYRSGIAILDIAANSNSGLCLITSG